jgi:hypothetical protein
VGTAGAQPVGTWSYNTARQEIITWEWSTWHWATRQATQVAVDTFDPFWPACKYCLPLIIIFHCTITDCNTCAHMHGLLLTSVFTLSYV